MRNIILALAWIIVSVMAAYGATYPAMSCSAADIKAASTLVTMSSDTVTVPAGAPCVYINSGTTPVLHLTRGFRLQAAGIGQTIIQDRTTGNTTGILLRWTLNPGETLELSGFEFQDGARATKNSNGLIQIAGSNVDTSFRLHHNRFGHPTTPTLNLRGVDLVIDLCVGLIDQNELYETDDRNNPIVTHCPSKDGVGLHGDAAWASAQPWGSPNQVYIERNTISYIDGSGRGITDGNDGGMFVGRGNTIHSAQWSSHGRETSRKRAIRRRELYLNTYTGAARPDEDILTSNRDGTTRQFLETVTSYKPGATALRVLGYYDPWSPWIKACTPDCPIGSGINPLDANGAGNPRHVLTVTGSTVPPAMDSDTGYLSPCVLPCSSAGTGTLTFAGTPFAGISLTATKAGGFALYLPDCTPLDDAVQCAAGILSNTDNSLTFDRTATDGNDEGLYVPVGDVVHVNSIIAKHDGPGRGGGDLLSGGTSSNLTTLTCGGVPCYFAGAVTWTNNQQWDPLYLWGNTHNGMPFNTVSVNDASYPTCVQDRCYFVETASFNGTSGIGRGPRSARPASTTNDVAWWAEDAGGNWNTLNGAANDGCLDRVVNGAWVNCEYIPYTYPHPLAGVAPAPDATAPTPGNLGALTTIPYTASTVQLSWALALDNASPQTELEYTAYQSLKRLSSLATVEAATQVMPYTKSVSQFLVTGLLSNRTYYFAVIVRDQAGNKTLYKIVQRKTR